MSIRTLDGKRIPRNRRRNRLQESVNSLASTNTRCQQPGPLPESPGKTTLQGGDGASYKPTPISPT